MHVKTKTFFIVNHYLKLVSNKNRTGNNGTGNNGTGNNGKWEIWGENLRVEV